MLQLLFSIDLEVTRLTGGGDSSYCFLDWRGEREEKRHDSRTWSTGEENTGNFWWTKAQTRQERNRIRILHHSYPNILSFFLSDRRRKRDPPPPRLQPKREQQTTKEKGVSYGKKGGFVADPESDGGMLEQSVTYGKNFLFGNRKNIIFCDCKSLVSCESLNLNSLREFWRSCSLTLENFVLWFSSAMMCICSDSDDYIDMEDSEEDDDDDDSDSSYFDSGNKN